MQRIIDDIYKKIDELKDIHARIKFYLDEIEMYMPHEEQEVVRLKPRLRIIEDE